MYLAGLQARVPARPRHGVLLLPAALQPRPAHGDVREVRGVVPPGVPGAGGGGGGQWRLHLRARECWGLVALWISK